MPIIIIKKVDVNMMIPDMATITTNKIKGSVSTLESLPEVEWSVELLYI